LNFIADILSQSINTSVSSIIQEIVSTSDTHYFYPPSSFKHQNPLYYLQL